MSRPVPAPRAKPRRIANWGPMLLGIVCLGIGLVFAIGAFVDLDYMDANHLDSWPLTVIIEIGVAVILAVFGPWCLLLGIRAPVVRSRLFNSSIQACGTGRMTSRRPPLIEGWFAPRASERTVPQPEIRSRRGEPR